MSALISALGHRSGLSLRKNKMAEQEYDMLTSAFSKSYLAFRIEHDSDAYLTKGYKINFLNHNLNYSLIEVSKETFYKFYKNCQGYLRKTKNAKTLDFHIECTTVTYDQIKK
jgi:hypothetical protein